MPDLGKAYEQIDECALASCQQPVFPGEQVWKYGCDVYCSLHHLSEDMGAKENSVEDK